MKMSSSLSELQAPDPSLCYLDTSENGAVAVMGQKSSITLVAIDFMNKACKGVVESLECELLSDLSDATECCSVKRTGQNLYEISYQPIATKVALHVKISGQHVWGSPLPLTVRPPIRRLFLPVLQIINSKCKLQQPWGVASGVAGRDLVAVTEEEGGNCVTVLHGLGGKRFSFGSYGSSKGEFDSPRGVAVDGEGNILVADYGNHRIQKFTAKGKFVSAVRDKRQWGATV